ncbi:MAG: acetylxylan esterase [Paludibacteraceae bacterium]|nr:acetylxylan esterase [Paludibacteraceae bacterium]
MIKLFFHLLLLVLALVLTSCKEPVGLNTDEPTPQSQDYIAVRGYITAKYHDWVWENGEQPNLEVYVVNPNSYDTIVPLKLTIKTCDVSNATLIDTITQMVQVKAGDSMAVYISPSKDLTPEIYKASIKLDNKSLKTIMLNWDGEHKISAFNIAVDPMKIESPYDGQPDFDEFWENTKKELRALYADNEVKLTVYKETANATIYLFEARSIKNIGDTLGIVRGYYSEPKAEGKYPLQIQFPPYDTPGSAFSCPLSGSATQCEMHVSPRGQYINMRNGYKNDYGEWIKYGIKRKETYYYRGAYMDCVRAVDFAFGREKVDTTQVFAYGSSQGGALTIATAALSDHTFAAISVCVPFLGDWQDFFKLSNGFPGDIKNAAKKEGMTEEDALRVLSYIDTKNLAHKVTCPVLEIICLQDDVVPPHTNASIYNNLTNCPDKGERLYISPLENHAWAQGWSTLMAKFFKKYSK